MISKDELVNSLNSKELDKVLVEELVEEYFGIQESYSREDYEKTLLKGGKFSETVFQLLEYIKEGNYSNEAKTSSLVEEMRNTESGVLPDSIRLLVPKIARRIYDMRNDRGGGHKSDVDHLYMDSGLVKRQSEWIISELLRVFGQGSDKEDKINNLISQSTPYVEEFENGDIMILADTESCKEDCLLILYHFYPERIANVGLKEYVDGHSDKNVTTSLRFAEEKKLVHRSEEGNKLTSKGIKYVEENYTEKLDGSYQV